MASSNDDQHERFLRLFTVNEASVHAFVRSLVPTLEDANDVMQETAVVLWRRFEEYDTQRDFRGWAFGVAKMQVLSWNRDRARDRHLFDGDLTLLLAEDLEKGADTVISRQEALRTCLEKLPSDQRHLVVTAYSSGVHIKELAKDFSQSVAAVYKRLHRIRVALIKCTLHEMTRMDWA